MVRYYEIGIDAKCPNEVCDSAHTVTDNERGEILCRGCGIVMAECLLDMSHEDQPHTPEEFMTQTRTGPTTSLVMHDRGLSTVIGADRDSAGNALPVRSRHEFNRLRIWDQRSKSRSAASMSKAFTMLHAMKTKLAVPNSVVERAAYIYRKVVAAGLTRGRTVASLMSVSLYVACRESDTPRILDDIVAISNVDKKVLFRDLRTVLRKLDINLNQYGMSSFVVKIANNMNLSENSKRMALDILRRSEEKMITAGKHPVALAAAAIYISCVDGGERITQRSLSKTAGVSDVTIRNSVTLMRDNLDMWE